MNPRVVAAASAAVLAIATPAIIIFEGKSLTTYEDVANIITVCVGHTKTVIPGKRYTDEECNKLLERDLREHDEGLRKCVKVPLSNHEHAAYLSFTFNVGVGAFCGSTLVRKLNTGDRLGACRELDRWVLADGKPWPGLVKRRAAERAMCEKELR